MMEISAWVMLEYWILIQALSAVARAARAGGGAVTFSAYVGAFVAGLALVELFDRRGLLQAKRAHVRFRPGRSQYGGLVPVADGRCLFGSGGAMLAT